jgi:hypothetical protein
MTGRQKKQGNQFPHSKKLERKKKKTKDVRRCNLCIITG